MDNFLEVILIASVMTAAILIGAKALNWMISMGAG